MFGLFFDLYTFAASYIILLRLIQILSVIMFIFSIIGIIATVQFFRKRRKPKETPGERWLRTGKMD